MKRSCKAALQSALIFPGVGHFGLDHYFRGSVLMLSSIVAILVLVKSVVRSTLSVFEGIHSGEIIAGDSIVEMITITANSAMGFSEKTAGLVLVICWLVGIIDAYKLGNEEEQLIQTKKTNEQG